MRRPGRTPALLLTGSGFDSTPFIYKKIASTAVPQEILFISRFQSIDGAASFAAAFLYMSTRAGLRKSGLPNINIE